MSSIVRNQAKLVGIALAAGLALTAFGTGTALAISPSQQECEAGGGTFTNQTGTKVCEFPEDNVGNAPDHSNSQTTQTTTTGQGNSGNKPTSECVGPPGQCK